MKTCRLCNIRQPLDNFGVKTSNRDGIRHECKSCVAIQNKSFREAKPMYQKDYYVNHFDYYAKKNKQYSKEYHAEYNKTYRKEHYYELLESHKKSNKKWNAANPDKVECHRLLNNAIAQGLITRQPCIICNETRSEGHHPDYNRAFDVMWLCRKHHLELHMED